jgi:hypothetical protein
MEYFADSAEASQECRNLSLTQRLGKMGRFKIALQLKLNLCLLARE